MRMTFLAVTAVVIAAPRGWTEPASAAPWISGLSRGHNILVQQGLHIQASCLAAVQHFDLNNWDRSNFTAAMFWQTYPARFLPAAPGIPWSMMSNDISGDINPSLYPYESKLMNYQFGDEQDVGDPAIWESLRSAMDSFHVNRPNVITYTNQWGSEVSTTSMQAYMQAVQPDMLCFDTYPFNGAVTGGSPTVFYAHMQKYRKLGLAGNDGTGTTPIPVGLYTQTFAYPGDHVVSESEIKLNNFAAWAFGYKHVNAFMYTGSADSALFSVNNTLTPTQQFYWVADTNRQSRNLGPALVRLLSTGVYMVMGKHGSGAANARPADVPAWTSTSVPYLTGVSPINMGSTNGGLSGDVIVSTFKPLDASFTNAGHAGDTYFMIVNGLTDANGSAAACMQNIRLTFDFGASGIDSLLWLNRDTGLVQTLNLIPQGGSKYSWDLYLDGGTGHLFKFNDGGSFVGFFQPHHGDANGDGKVNEIDAAILAENWLTSSDATWMMGDFNDDQIVNELDAAILAANWNHGISSSAPEPPAATLLIFVVCAVTLWRLKQH